MSDDDAICVGHVKWFDSTKGYGFVVAPDLSRDVLLHANVLRNFGQNSVADGSRIRLRIVETERGTQAQDVLEIEPPENTSLDTGERRTLPFDETLIGGELKPARVKWFDRAKGFGFANVFGVEADVFIHIEVLRRSSLADLQPGEAIAIRVAEGARGQLATQVHTWESAAKHAYEEQASADDGAAQSEAELWNTSEAAE